MVRLLACATLALGASAFAPSALPRAARAAAAAARRPSSLAMSSVAEAHPVKPHLPSTVGVGALPLSEVARNLADPATEIPKKGQVLAALPKHLRKRDTKKSMRYMWRSVALSLACVAGGLKLPATAAAAPLWALYGAVTGTVWTGCWVVAHECGHNAFSDDLKLQDRVGFILHSLLLVPYYSWQRSHAVHHAQTNHIHLGETHVPYTERNGKSSIARRAKAAGGGKGTLKAFSLVRVFSHLVMGWPAYLLLGSTGSPERGPSNHFIPTNDKLFPGQWKQKVYDSSVGVGAVLGALGLAASRFGLPNVLRLYALPYAFTNVWLVLYTWMQHTHEDVAHFDERKFSYMRGAFSTIDRPYGPVFNWLHHGIGSTHVTHHIDCTIPHYHAWEVTEIIKKTWPHLYLYDPTPVMEATIKVARDCVAVHEDSKEGAPDGVYWFKNGDQFLKDREPQTA